MVRSIFVLNHRQIFRVGAQNEVIRRNVDLVHIFEITISYLSEQTGKKPAFQISKPIGKRLFVQGDFELVK